MSDRKQQILEKLSAIMDPDLGRDIVSLGFVKQLTEEDGRVSFTLELTTPACPLKESFRSRAGELVKELDFVKDVTVTLSSKPRVSRPDGPSGLRDVRRIIAVSSCKGGVGKSTVAVNLAYALSAAGAAVGLLDADVYGPSLPTLTGVHAEGLMQKDGLIVPLESSGLKLMSFGWATPPHKAAVMRGPMVSSVVTQLAAQTDWGALDYLVVDMPPGTGDIALTLTQKLPLSGAVIVTTPQKLSTVDVVKGMQMFETVNVPTLCIVENMSWFECSGCHQKHRLFGQGSLAALKEQYGIENTFELPLLPQVAENCDRGVPTIVADPEGILSKTFSRIAAAAVQEIEKIENNGISIPEVTFVKGEGIVVTKGNERRVIDPADLRRRCRCASCRDEFTGEPILNPGSIAADIIPLRIEKMGNYAVAIEWSDGHTSSIYSYSSL